MSSTRYLAPEFELEMQSTRRVLERVPEDRLAWQPHPKSYTLGQLASHVAQLPDWVSSMFTADGFNFRPEGGPAYRAAKCESRRELLELFDSGVQKMRSAIATARDDTQDELWTLRGGDVEFFTLPRWQVYRQWGMNHMVHHRAQLGVYLRLLDVPVPGTYGPSADTPPG
ncbi:MAG TPA: DinB family protein [Gemmatimonadaceae bacterium]